MEFAFYTIADGMSPPWIVSVFAFAQRVFSYGPQEGMHFRQRHHGIDAEYSLSATSPYAESFREARVQ